MPVKSNYTITHSYGHKSNKNLSHKPAGQRDDLARWWNTMICTGCRNQQSKQLTACGGAA